MNLILTFVPSATVNAPLVTLVHTGFSVAFSV